MMRGLKRIHIDCKIIIEYSTMTSKGTIGQEIKRSVEDD